MGGGGGEVRDGGCACATVICTYNTSMGACARCVRTLARTYVYESVHVCVCEAA